MLRVSRRYLPQLLLHRAGDDKNNIIYNCGNVNIISQSTSSHTSRTTSRDRRIRTYNNYHNIAGTYTRSYSHAEKLRRIPANGRRRGNTYVHKMYYAHARPLNQTAAGPIQIYVFSSRFITFPRDIVIRRVHTYAVYIHQSVCVCVCVYV